MIQPGLLDAGKRNADSFMNQAGPVSPVTPPNSPLVIVKSNDQLALEKQQSENANTLPAPAVLELAAHIRRQFEKAQSGRNDTEQSMLADLRQRKGEYDAATLALIEQYGQPTVFDNITETKCYAAESWIKDILIFQAKDKAWGLDPTPKPDISPDDEKRIVEKTLNKVAMAIQASGRFPSEQEVYDMARLLRASMAKQIKDDAHERAIRMETVIEDVLAEGSYDEAWNDYIYYFTTFPVGILKGPVIRRVKKPVWAPGPGGKMVPIVQEQLVETFEAVNALDAYPDPMAVEIADGFFIERKRLSPQAIRDLTGMPGYKEPEVKAVLDEYGAGGLRIWTPIDAFRATLEDKNNAVEQQNFIECLEYWDEVDGKLLNEWENQGSPLTEDQPRKWEEGVNYSIMAEQIGPHVIRVVLNPDPTGQKPYFKSCFRKVAGSFWGKSLPVLIRDEQTEINSLARATIKNVGQAAGPQAEVDNSRMSPGEDVTAIHPDKIWQTDCKGVNYSHPAVKFFQPDLIAPALMEIRDRIAKQADDKSGVPPYSYGNEQQMGAGRTLGGLQLLMSSAAKGIRNAIHAVDVGTVKPMIKRLWTYEMLYNDDESIKGDVNIVARGAMALFIKDQISMRRTELLQVICSNQGFMGLLGAEGISKLLRQTFEAADVDPDGIVPDDEQLKARAAQAQQQMQADQQAAIQQQQRGAGAPQQGAPARAAA